MTGLYWPTTRKSFIASLLGWKLGTAVVAPAMVWLDNHLARTTAGETSTLANEFFCRGRLWRRWFLIIGTALVLSDLAHHFLVLLPITGQSNFDLSYPDQPAAPCATHPISGRLLCVPENIVGRLDRRKKSR